MFIASIRDDSTSNPSTFDNAGVDILSGGAGYDTLKIYQSYENDDVYVLNASGIEHLMYQTTDEDELYLNGMTDIEKITVFQSDDTGNDFYNVQNLVDVGFENNIGSSDANIYVEDTVEAGAVAITLKSNGTNAIDLTYQNNSGDDMATSIAITATGTNDDVDLNSTDVTESVTVAGSGTLDLYLDDTDELTSVDASAYTGDLTLGALTAQQDIAVTGGSGDDSVDVTARASTGASDEAITTVSGGAGNDSITVTSAAGLQTLAVNGGDGDDTITADVSSATVDTSTASISTGAGVDEVTVTADTDVALTVDLGDGDDVLTINTVNATDDVTDSISGGAGLDALRGLSANLAAIEADDDQLATISGFEAIVVSNVLGDDFDLTTWGVSTIALETADASAGAITLASGNTILITDDDGTTGIVDAVVDGASDAGSNDDVLNIAFEADYNGADSVDLADMSVDFVETVNITVADEKADTEGTGTITVSMTDADRVDTITVASDQTTVVEGDDFAALNTFDASASTGGVTVDVSTATQGVVMTGGSGDDIFTGSDFADIVDMGDGDNTYNASLGADAVTIGEGASTLVFAADTSVEGAITSITGFNAVEDADNVDALNLGAAVAAADATVDVSGADADAGTTDIDATIVDGIITLSGDDAAVIDTLAEWINVAEIIVNDADATAEFVAFEFGGDTYVVESDGADTTSNIIKLVGVTGIEAIDTTAADGTILIS